MDTGRLLTESGNCVTTIFFNNPEKLNALSPETVEQLLKTLRELEEDREIRIIVLRGKSGNFSAGADLKALEKFTPTEALEFHRKMNEIIRLMNSSGKIFIAAMEGYAMGGAFELALSTDIRICTEDAILGQPEINVGLNAGAGGNAILPDIVGRSNALYLVLTGMKLSARRAYELGIVQVISEKGQLDNDVESLVRTILEHPNSTVEMSKHAVNSAFKSSSECALEVEALTFALLHGDEEVKNSIRKFLKK